MKKLRTFFGIDDDLQEFAERFLNTGGILFGSQSLTRADGALVNLLYSEGRFQVELCAIPGGTVIPPHVHPNADTIEVSLGGAMRLHVNGVDPFEGMPDEIMARRGKWRGIRINHTDVHGTTVPDPGTMFLSIQRWVGKPASVLPDYRGAPLGPEHRAMYKEQAL